MDQDNHVCKDFVNHDDEGDAFGIPSTPLDLACQQPFAWFQISWLPGNLRIDKPGRKGYERDNL